MVIFGGLLRTSRRPSSDSLPNVESSSLTSHFNGDSWTQQNGNNNHCMDDGGSHYSESVRTASRQRRESADYGSLLAVSSSDEQEIPSLTREFYNFESVGGDALRLCGIYTAIYICIAVIAFSFVFEKWTVIDSIYFAVSTFTTCGYGDLQPTTQAGQLFTIVFAIYGVLILGIFIGIIGHSISEAQAKAMKQLKNGNQEAILHTLFPDAMEDQGRLELSTRRLDGFISDHVTLLDDIVQVVRTELPEILVVAAAAFILGWREGWSFTSTMYFCIMSATTTGFGDYTPQTQIDKLYCVFFLPLAVAVFGEVLGRIASIYIRRKTRQAEKAFLRRSITRCDLRKMDANDDGMVDMEEFLTFMLVALQKVDKKFIDDLRNIFHSLDKNDNGMIDKDDLVTPSANSFSTLHAIEQVVDT